MGNSITKKFSRACEILDRYERSPHKLIPILQDMQAEYNYLPEEIMTFISVALGISPSTVYGVATFYAHFTLEPKGRHIIKVCDGTACHVKNSEGILSALVKYLGLTDGKGRRTTGSSPLKRSPASAPAGSPPPSLSTSRSTGR